MGTWYLTKTNYITYNADGTFSTFGNMGMEGYTYKFLPFQGRILTFSPDGQMLDATVLYLTDEMMYLRDSQHPFSYVVYYRTQPPQPVNRITLSETQVGMNVGETVQLTAVVYPSDADNTEVVWSSSDENVVTVDKRQRRTGHLLRGGCQAPKQWSRICGFGALCEMGNHERGRQCSRRVWGLLCLG